MEKVELNSQELNLNLISLDKFEQLPQKKQSEDETKNLKKKKKKCQGKKSSDNSNPSVKVSFATTETKSTTSKTFTASKAPTTSKVPTTSKISITPSTTSKVTTTPKTPTTSSAPTENTVPTVPTVPTSLPNNLSTTDAKFPHPFRPPKQSITQPFYPHPHPHPHPHPYPHPHPHLHSHQMNIQRFPFYSPRYSQMNVKIRQPSQFYLHKKPIESVQPRHDINPRNRKQEKPPLLFPRKSDSQKVIYMIPDMKIETNKYGSISFPTTELWFDHLNSTTTSLLRTHENNHCIAIDCEMVGVGEKGKYSVLARVSIVNYYGEVLLDRFVKSTREITDYRTKFSGITPELLIDACEFKQVQKEVEKIMKDHVVVGQSIYFDFKVLKTRHPEHLIRDTSHYNTIFGIETKKGVTPSLKNLAKDVLGINIQEGEHDSIEDARASMILYRHRQAEWEEHLKTNGFPRPKECKFCDSSSHVSKKCPYNKKKSKNDKGNLDKNNLDQNGDVDHDEYNRDPNTSKYYSYRYPNNYNPNYAPVNYI